MSLRQWQEIRAMPRALRVERRASFELFLGCGTPLNEWFLCLVTTKPPSVKGSNSLQQNQKQGPRLF
jgi:hypothetical protein